MIEIDRRSKSCVGGYPFALDLKGTVLRHDPSDSSERAVVYHYLLLSTRRNMTSDKVQADIDGTGLLEEISASVLRCYLGYDRAQSVVFGTAIGGTFRDKVDALCGALGEGGCFEALDPGPVNANDDRLDSVVWIPFSDMRAGKLIIFCQCKTGSNWKEHTTQLQPDAFIKLWMKHRASLVVPIRAFCVSESTCPTHWGGLVSYAGLLFDRLRLVDFLDPSSPICSSAFGPGTRRQLRSLPRPLTDLPPIAEVPDEPSTTATPGTTTAAPGASTGDESTGDPTTGGADGETALVVHSFGARAMAPFEETEPCAQWTLHNEEPLYVNTVTLSNYGGFHHSNWLVVPEDVFPGEDGYFNCWERDFNELQAAVAGTVLFAQSTQSRYEAQALPTGVVIKIPPRHKLVAGTHLLNLSSAEAVSELRMGLTLIHPRDAR